MASIAQQLIGTVAEGTQQTSSNLQAGAQLARSVQDVQARRAQMEQQKQEIELAKIDKLTSAMETGARMKSSRERSAFFKHYIPNMQKALGLQGFVPEETMAMIQADPESAKKFSLLRNQLMTGEKALDEIIASMDPEAWAGMDTAEVEQLEAAEKFRIQQAGMTARAGKQGTRLGEQFQTREMAKLNSDVRAAFKPIEDKRNSIRTANDSLMAVKSDIEAGKKASSIDFNVAARGLAKAFNSGAMTDEDVNDFKRLAGVEDITEANIKKYITGGAPKEAVAALSRIADRAAKNLDRQAQTIGKGFESRIGLFDDKKKATEASGLSAYSSPTLGGKSPAGGKTYNVRGKQLSADQIKGLSDAAKSLLDPEIKKELGIK